MSMVMPIPARIKVFVHLARGFDARRWEERWLRGQLIGLNTRFPYGYHLANDLACDVVFSKDGKESWIGLGLRRILRVCLGFDLIHAWRNRRAMSSADVVWTHTESQALAVALLRKVMRAGKKPKLLAQTVWLIDGWPKLSYLRRAFYRWLMQDADVLTFLSPLNRNKAQSIFPGKRCEFVRFGIASDIKDLPRARRMDGTMRIIAVGNDRHRDWACLVEAFGNLEGAEVRLVTTSLSSKELRGIPNVEIVKVSSNDGLLAAYRWADVVVLPLHENLHASGITVLQEAARLGKPVVCTRAGGLDAYFSDNEVAFVEPHHPEALRVQARRLAKLPDAAVAMARRAQARMEAGDLSATAFVKTHVDLSKILLSGPAVLVPRPRVAQISVEPIAVMDRAGID